MVRGSRTAALGGGEGRTLTHRRGGVGGRERVAAAREGQGEGEGEQGSAVALVLTLLVFCRSLDSFSSLSPSSPPPAKGARSSSSQTTFSSSTTDDLCSLSTLLVLSAPGLHYSDLSLLPSSASSPAGVKASLAHFGASDVAGSTVTHPYVSHRQKSKPAGLIRRFVKECGATVQAGDDQVWHGGEEKSVRIVNLKGLDEWELTGREAREGRKEVMSEIGAFLSLLFPCLPLLRPCLY